ncbi:MAG: betaine-aldehyde dehydrogenase, partial [Thermoleophilia bacterium]|nr:betaine-aldehyde dehydrogenase [Thermoleophilia bacterium]
MATKPTSSSTPAKKATQTPRQAPPKTRTGVAGPNRWDYAPAPESTSIVQLRDRYDHFIGGEWVKPASKKYFTTVSPSTLKPLAEVAEGTAKDVDKAVRAARAAFENDWSKRSGAERGRFLFRIARILQERAREFAVQETMDGGKPIKQSRDVDLPLAAAHFFYDAGWADKLEYAFPGQKVRPLGVAGQVIPWNFPLMMLAWKVAPALAAGNTVVLNPAETTPLKALLFCEVLEQAGLP